ncbi:MAG: hypothetical protein FJ202_03375 [Gemmatimonadetes bacterium]|nr:hypothetical protein [Gemmatimonadota bacterium]
MTRALILRTVLVAAAFAAGTFIAWWMVPVAAAAFGYMTARDRGGPIVAGLAAILAWGGLIAWNAMVGPATEVAALLGGVLQVRPSAVYVLTLAFAGLAAVCAAVLGRAAYGVLPGAERGQAD